MGEQRDAAASSRDISRDTSHHISHDTSRHIIHHIALVEDWEAAQGAGVYTVSTRGATLDDVGFIHCARPDQIVGVLNRYYDDLDEVIVLDLAVGGLDVREDPVEIDGAVEYFPHLYGPLPLTSVHLAATWRRNMTRW